MADANMFSILFSTTAIVQAVYMSCRVSVSCEVIDGKKFVRLSKGDKKIARLLVSGGSKSGDNEEQHLVEPRPLSHTSIIETIIKLRDDAFDAAVPNVGPGPRRYNNKPTKRKLLELPDICQVELPAIGPTVMTLANVKMEKPCVRTVAIELTDTVLEYLHAVCEYQRGLESEKRQHPRVHHDNCPLGPGLSKVYEGKYAGGIRASHSLDNGKKQTSFFVVGDACREDVIAKATQFAMSGRQQPSDSASEGECEQGDCSTIE